MRHIERQYAGGEDRPLEAFAATLSIYAAMTALLGGVVAGRRRLPRGIGWSDIVLLSVATFKVSRVLAKDPVTSPLRAPFTRFEGTSGPAELQEEVRGSGMRKAIGELITCPFCLAQWTATILAFGIVLIPRPTRFFLTIMTAVSGADFLQLAYDAAQPGD